MLTAVLRSFARRTSKTTPKPAPSAVPREEEPHFTQPPPKSPIEAAQERQKTRMKNISSEFPSEFRKAGMKKKDVDPDFLQYFLNLKAKGLPQQIGNIFADRLSKGETPEEIVNSFIEKEMNRRKTEQVEEKPEPSPKKISKKPPVAMNLSLPPEAEERLSQYMKQFEVAAEIQDTATRKKDLSFREKGKADLVKAYEEEGKYTGPLHGGGEKGDSKVRHEVEKRMKITDLEVLQNPSVVVNPTAFQEYLLDLDPDEKKHIRRQLEADEATERKAKALREKVKQKREIRDKYKQFKISVHREEKEEGELQDAVVSSTEGNVKQVLAEILNSSKTGIRQGIAEDGFINVIRVQSNKSLSVMNVFYSVFRPEMEIIHGLTPAKAALRESVRRKLVHAERFITSQLTRKAGLKYAPELRFIPYVLGAPPRQTVDPKATEEAENNSELFYKLATIDDQKYMTPKLPGKYTVRSVKEAQESQTKKKKSS